MERNLWRIYMIKLDSSGWEVLSKIGLTGHPGGKAATDRLASLCKINPRQSILVVGCGSGHTACYLANKWKVNITAFDFAFGMAKETKTRSQHKGVQDNVSCLQADAQLLPFQSSAFDGVFAES